MTIRHLPTLCWAATWSLCCIGVGQAIEAQSYADVIAFLPLAFMAAAVLSGQLIVR